MEFRVGDTFLIKNPRDWDDRRHLFIIISVPTSEENKVMLLPCLESFRNQKDQSCLLDVGEHPFIKHRSAINYRDCVELEESTLDALILANHAKKKESLTLEALEKVLNGARVTKNLTKRQKAMLPDQGHE